jgi:uncharacterized membrane protein YkvA (DUF1232 family)
LLQDYFAKEYDKVPLKTIVLVISSFIFVVSPLRVLPKWIPLGGFMERILVLVLVLEYIKEDLQDYSNWKLARNG